MGAPTSRWLDRVPAIAAGWAAVVAGAELAAATSGAVAPRGRAALAHLPGDALASLHVSRVPLALGFVALAYLLVRRRRRGWQLAVALLLTLSAANLFAARDVIESLVCLGGAGALALLRGRFYVLPQKRRGREWLVVASVLLATAAIALVGAGAVSLLTHQDLGLRELVTMAGALLSVIPVPDSLPEPADWLAVLVNVVALGSVAVVGRTLFGPLRGARPPAPSERDRARELVRAFGDDTLAFFKLRPDKHCLFTASADAVLGFRIEAGCLVISGDPVGPMRAHQELLARARTFARKRGLKITVVNASEAFAATCQRFGLRSMYLGDEAIVATDFSLEGRRVRKVRQSVNRLKRLGFAAELRQTRELPPEIRAEVAAVSRAARGRAPERGFSSAVSAEDGQLDNETTLLLARDGTGRLRGFLYFVPCYGRPVVSLSTMCRDPESPNGLTEFMIVAALEGLHVRGVIEASLNYAALARYIHEPRNWGQRTLGRVAILGDSLFQVESLYRFNAKFAPRWHPRFLVYEGRLGLLRSAAAALLAEGQLSKPTWPRPVARTPTPRQPPEFRPGTSRP